jgi:hypothetical protein
MPRTAPLENYVKTVIYKIVCKTNDVYAYVGHTTNLANRKHAHINNCRKEELRRGDVMVKNTAYNLPIYKTIRENGGMSEWEFVIIEEYPCENVTEASVREQYWINELRKENKQILNYKQAHGWNLEKIKQNSKALYAKNREYYLEKARIYYENNKETKNERSKAYYHSHKDAQKAYQKAYQAQHAERLKEYQKNYRLKNI